MAAQCGGGQALWDEVGLQFSNRIKHFRRLATRYEKHAANFLAVLKLPPTYGCAIMSL